MFGSLKGIANNRTLRDNYEIFILPKGLLNRMY